MSLIPLGFWGGTQSFIPTADFPTYGWSFWKRNPNYTGACIRVMRWTDKVQQDIGFASNNFLDTAALLSFVGNDNGVVRTFYAQFGNINLTGPSWADNFTNIYPRIVTSGVLETFVNGQAAMQFGLGAADGWMVLQGGSGTDMMAHGNATVYWNEQSSASVETMILANNINASHFALSAIAGSSSTLLNYGLISLYENYYINESLAIEGYKNGQNARTLDLYDYRSYRSNDDGAKLFAMRGVGDFSGTGLAYGGRWDNQGSPFRGKSNEVLIYNNTTHSHEKTKEIQKYLNISHDFYDTNDMTKDLILWYDAGNITSYPGSGTAITDLSVGGAGGSLVNGVGFSTADGGKWILDGINDWIGSTGTFNFPWSPRSSDFSYEVWVKLPNLNQAGSIWSTRNSSSGTQMSMFVGSINVNGSVTATKKVSIAIQGDNSGYEWWHTTNDIADNTWKHIICTRSQKVVKIYVNGVEQPLTLVNRDGFSVPMDVITGTSGWRSGDFGGGVGGAGAFEISIMRLYKCELTESQVTRNFNLEKSRYGL